MPRTTRSRTPAAERRPRQGGGSPARRAETPIVRLLGRIAADPDAGAWAEWARRLLAGEKTSFTIDLHTGQGPGPESADPRKSR